MGNKGTVASWDDEKGYGFIVPDNGGPKVFFHIKALRNRGRRPVINDIVTYAVGKDDQGRIRATRATLAGKKSRDRGTPSILIALSFLVVVGISVLETGLPIAVLITYLVLSAVTFIAYAKDKRAARSGRWRTKEGTLHLFALAGGWPGALIAQQTLRHKSKKMSFRFMLWATVLLNCAALVWLHTADGRAALEPVLAAIFDATSTFVDSP